MAEMAVAISTRKQDLVTVEGDTVAIVDLHIVDPELLAFVTDAEDRERAARQCLSVGARALRGVQTSVDAAVVKAEFGELAAKLDRAIEGAVRQLGQTTERFFDPGEGVLRKNLDALKAELDKSLGETFDAESKKSALSKLEEVFAKATNGQAKIVRDLVDPGNAESPLGRLRGEMAKELKELRDTVSRLQTHLAVEQAKSGVMELTAVKGLRFEDEIFVVVTEFAALYGDLPEMVGKTSGLSGGCVGDQVVTLNQEDTPGASGVIAIEVKDRKLNLRDALAELDAAIANRGASTGLIVFSRQSLAPVKAPFAQFGHRGVVVFDKDSGDGLALRVALSWARCEVARQLGTPTLKADIKGALALVDKAKEALKTESVVKRYLTGGHTQLNHAEKQVERLVAEVRAILTELAPKLGR
jgi:hypothetical protein